jgi:excisionase family DNA binding protein
MSIESTAVLATPVDRLLRGGEVAALLGISRALAYRWMQAGILPVIRVPGARTVRVPQGALDEWIRAHTGFRNRKADSF